MTLTEFLLARIAEDEDAARTVTDGGSGQWQSWNRSWDPEPVRDIATDGKRIASVPTTLDEFMCSHDPARVLAECEAKRRIVVEARRYDLDAEGVRAAMSDGDEGPYVVNLALKSLALPYAAHPDYLDEWKP